MKLITLAAVAAITFTTSAFGNESIIPVSQEIKDTTANLRDKAIKDDSAYEILKSLTTEVGARHPGTPGEKAGIEWGVNKLKTLGFDKVYTEDVKMNGWLRGTETAEILLPSYQKMVITTLGRSKSTPKGGLEAEIVHFKSYADLEKATDGSLKGKIAFISKRMEKFKDGAGYGPAVIARSKGHELAAQKGAEALLIRSIGTDDHRNPHTGSTNVAMGYTAVPAIALSNPDADQLIRLMNYGHTPKIRLNVQTQDLGPIVTKNVIGEITGREFPDEVVVIGGHLDSWDLGTGAVDDGAGVAIAMATAALIKNNTKERPRRTIRVILWGAEELGLIGARAYAKARQEDGTIAKHVIGSESDFGAGPIYGLQSSSNVSDNALHVIDTMASLMGTLGVSRRSGDTTGGPDMIPLSKLGVPALKLMQDGTDYFDLHHTPDDTFDKVNPEHMRQNVAAWTVFTYIAAEWPGSFK
ncbi:M20/M25/M40 family metallo-hydrolase [Colwellia sp. 6_MG-2023]|uniref:M20/M25/M40 family metallo-hydrolase n=1 Tax=Colwellia sp. 6_MG-2023 TaxID=3062676 RepID=UPI0026E42E53|nr:M20/M25/M40 family metallo-hydrolase [Colwellia sp. 6_MG-2023]MDO6488900.1 M20/M25/M40 family metallo-hydrolase [Colwellia sp. 6_MG-2023]